MDQQNRGIMTRTEKGILTVPGARQSPPAFNQSGSLPWTFQVPTGKALQGLRISALLTTVGAGMTTTRLSQIFQAIKVYNANGLIADIDQYTLDLLAAVSHALKHTDDYLNRPTNTDVVRDPANVATGAALYGSWDIHCPLPGDVFKVLIELFDSTAVFGAGMTGGIPSISVVPIWTNSNQNNLKKQYNIFAKRLVNVTHRALQGVEMICISALVDIATIGPGLDLGGKMTVEEMTERQSIANDMLRGLLVDGTASLRTLLVRDPLTNANTYLLIKKADDAFIANLDLTTGSDLKVMAWSELQVEKVSAIA
jgi:hypothetical protein